MGDDSRLLGYFKDSLTEVEKSKIEQFCKDEVLLGAVRKVLLQGLYVQGTIQKGFDVDPQTNGAFSLASLAVNNPIPDAEIGAGVRAQWAGMNYLKNAFDTLELIKNDKDESVESPYNEAI